MLPGAALGSLAARLLAGAALQALGQHFRLCTVPERVSGPPPLDAARRSTFEPRGSFLLAGAALQALDGTRARFGGLPRCCRLAGGSGTVQSRLRFCWQKPAQHLAASRLVSAGRGSTSGSGRYPSAFRGPPLDAARRSTWEPRGSFLLAGAALQALDGTTARFGAPPLFDAARRSTWFGPPPS